MKVERKYKISLWRGLQLMMLALLLLLPQGAAAITKQNADDPLSTTQRC